MAAVGIALLFLSACGKKPLQDPAIEELMRSNLHYAQTEDRKGYMSTLSPQSPIRLPTETMLTQVFSLFDLSYEMEDLEVTANDGETAVVRVTQLTRKVKGPSFRDNRVRMTNELRKVDGRWTIYNSSVDKIEYLD